MQGPLGDIKVLELGHIVAGPSASMLLGDLGADVIKIENPHTGDAARNMPNDGAAFYAFNHNKRSMGIDLKSPSGLSVFERLVRESDVVIENYSPGAVDKLGIGYEWASTVNPGIIYCSIKGFLPGPKEDFPFLDELAQMAAGLAYMTGPAGQPLRAGASIVDMGAATYGVVGVLAALFERQKTGHGRQVNVGLFETAAFWVGQHLSQFQLDGKVPDPMPVSRMGPKMGWAVYRLFDTKDGRQIFIAATSNQHWQNLCSALSMPDLSSDAELDNNRKRVEHRERINTRIAETVENWPFDALTEELQRWHVPCAPLNRPSDLLEDPHLIGRRHLVSMPVPGAPDFKSMAAPVEMGFPIPEVYCPPPGLGEQSRQILTDLGFTVDEIERLINDGTVGSEVGMLLLDEVK